MRSLVIVFLTILITKTYAQSFATYRDTVNHFSIEIPVGWKYGLPKDYPSIKLMAYRTPISPEDTSKDNFNLNIVVTPNSNLEETYPKFLESLKSVENFKLVNAGDTSIDGRKFKWLIETHRYSSDNIQLHNYDFLTYQNGKTYIITFTTFSNRFNIIKPTFTEIATSFKLTK
ncbi:MAG: hypothetical protein V4717_20540 [Bacteroidota bacterium]